MYNLFGLNNVFYDTKSIYSDFNSLNETLFLDRLFIELKNNLDIFDDCHFYLFCGDGFIRPESANINRPKLGMKILIYLSDETGSIPKDIINCYDVIFKIHLKKAYPEINVYPFPLGCTSKVEELSYITPQNRKYSCFYSGNLNPGREKFWLHFIHPLEKFLFKFQVGKLRLLNKYTKLILLRWQHFSKFDNRYNNSIIRFTSKFGGGFPPNVFAELLQNSRIVICPKGFLSAECYRHYEAMRAGCIIVSEPLPKTYFYKDSPIIEVSDWKDLDQIISELEASPDREKQLSLASKEWYRTHMSEKAVALYMIDIIKKQK